MSSLPRTNLPRSRLTRAFDQLILRSWWVLVFIGAAYVVFAHGMHQKKIAYNEISNQLVHLEKEKEAIIEMQEDLLLQINSQNDPAYIQMVLMKQLGVVPEGYKKVHFQEE